MLPICNISLAKSKESDVNVVFLVCLIGGLRCSNVCAVQLEAVTNRSRCAHLTKVI